MKAWHIGSCHQKQPYLPSLQSWGLLMAHTAWGVGLRHSSGWWVGSGRGIRTWNISRMEVRSKEGGLAASRRQWQADTQLRRNQKVRWRDLQPILPLSVNCEHSTKGLHRCWHLCNQRLIVVPALWNSDPVARKQNKIANRKSLFQCT